MSNTPDPNSPAGMILRLLQGKLEAIEAEMKRLGWWSKEPPDLQAEVAAGRLKSWLEAPSFELWLQCIFIPNAQERVKEGDLPAGSSVGGMARRQYDYHSHVPEAMPLLELLREFDGLVEAWNFHRTVEASPDSGESSAAAPPAAEPAGRAYLITPAEGAPLDFENILLEKKRGMLTTLTEIEREAAALLEQESNKQDATLQWLTSDFAANVRQWLTRGQVPQESRVGEAAETEWRQSGVLGHRAGLTARLMNFDAQVAAWHDLSRRLEMESAQGRLQAAWRCVMLPAPVLEKPLGAEPDTVRTWMLLTLNRVEAELRGAGWWAESPPPLPPEHEGTVNYSAGHRGYDTLPPYPHWLQSSLLPALRARIQAGEIPDVQRMSDDANRMISEVRLGTDKYSKIRPLYDAMDRLQTLLERAWPAALKRKSDTARLRGLTPPPSAAGEKAAAEFIRFRKDVAEAVEEATAALQAPLWTATNTSQDPPPFEQWLRAVFLPDAAGRLTGGRPLEERGIHEFARRECRLLGLTDAAERLLTALERIDRMSDLANRALRDQWEAG